MYKFPDCDWYGKPTLIICLFGTGIHYQNAKSKFVGIDIFKFIFVRYKNNDIYQRWVTRLSKTNIFLVMY